MRVKPYVVAVEQMTEAKHQISFRRTLFRSKIALRCALYLTQGFLNVTQITLNLDAKLIIAPQQALKIFWLRDLSDGASCCDI